MSEQATFPDELGQAVGPQHAAQEALEVEILQDQSQGPAAADSVNGEPPADSGTAQSATAMDWEPILRTGIGALFAVLESKWKSFATNDAELDQLARAWAPVAAKYGGSALSVETMAVIATLAIVAPKAVGAMQESAAARKAKRAAADKGPRDPGTVYVGDDS